MIRALSVFVALYAGDISVNEFAKRLGRYNPQQLLLDGDSCRGPRSKHESTARLMLAQYNKGYRKNILLDKF